MPLGRKKGSLKARRKKGRKSEGQMSQCTQHNTQGQVPCLPCLPMAIIIQQRTGGDVQTVLHSLIQGWTFDLEETGAESLAKVR